MAYKDNVEILDESYVPGGFGTDDYLIPNKPDINWQDIGVSYAGGFGFLPQETAGNAFGGEDPEDVDLSGIQPARKRRSGLANTMLSVADLFKISASMPNVYGQSAIAPGSAYLGMSEEEANNRAKIRSEEDLAGKEMDINRAKVLSMRAAATNDSNLKKKYGAAIKSLLPEETQGLDDLTASEFFNSTDNKLKLEQLKGYNKLQQIALQNEGKANVAGMNNATKELIAMEKVNAQIQMNELDNQIKQSVADGKNETALALQDKKSELQKYVHQLDNAADMEREIYKQNAATGRTQMTVQGAMDRQLASNAGALERVQAQQEGSMARTEANNKAKMAIAMMKPIGGAGAGGGKGTAAERAANEEIMFRAENWDSFIGQQEKDLSAIQKAIDVLEENPSATGFSTHLGMKFGGAGIFPATERAYGELNELTTRMVMEIIKQLNEAGATSSVFNSPAEQEKIIGTIMDPSASYNSRLASLKSFKQRLQSYYDKEREKTAWKASKLGYNVSGQPMRSNVVSAAQTNANSKKIAGGQEW